MNHNFYSYCAWSLWNYCEIWMHVRAKLICKRNWTVPHSIRLRKETLYLSRDLQAGSDWSQWYCDAKKKAFLLRKYRYIYAGFLEKSYYKRGLLSTASRYFQRKYSTVTFVDKNNFYSFVIFVDIFTKLYLQLSILFYRINFETLHTHLHLIYIALDLYLYAKRKTGLFIILSKKLGRLFVSSCRSCFI